MQNQPYSLESQPALSPPHQSTKNQYNSSDNYYQMSNVTAYNQIPSTASQKEEVKIQTNYNPPIPQA